MLKSIHISFMTAMEIFKLLRKDDEVLNHSFDVAPNFNFSPQEFYELIEKELAARKIPGLEISRAEHAEGGILSGKRVYLRMIRERLAFDVCAAPFGVDYFFTCRAVYSPVKMRFWHVLFLLALLGLVYSLLIKPLGLVYAGVAVGGLFIAIALMMRNTVAMGLTDLDAALLKTPVVGPIYEHVFRKDSYYRQDTRMAYLEIVPKIIAGLVDEITAAKGVKLIRKYQNAPIFGELYKPVPPRQPESGENM